MVEPKPASSYTAARNAPRPLPFDPADFDRARRGLIAHHPTGVIDTPQGTVWDVSRYAFISPDGDNPDTVHPSLWRQAQLNAIHGLFEVSDGVWQARGYDISNITFVAGRTGWIVIDPLTAEPCARACLEMANQHLGERPVVAVIYTHSHADHFGGVLGVTSQADVDAGRCRVIAPEHFMRETVGENVLVGAAMNRRAMYQFGPLLPPGPRQHVDCGLGKAIPLWPPGLIAPTEDITSTGQELVVDGVRIQFQLAPESEAPAEMQFFFPDQGWLCTAENCTHNMHNLVPIRGALVRDALKWSKYIDEMISLFGRDVTLMFASHHWPRWGNVDVNAYLRTQRDLYRWMHDQTLRRANHGLTAIEIAEALTLPAVFADESHTVGYYGHLGHNVKAVYQRYLSWYDGNPAHLWVLPPAELGARYVDLAGGADAALAVARTAFDDGDYRWAAELLNHLVFADPTNEAARSLHADTLEQLGYQSESATFRNAYLTGAHELRRGCLARRPVRTTALMRAMSVEQIFDAMGVRLKDEEVVGVSCDVDMLVIDVGERWTVGIDHGALHAHISTPPFPLTSAEMTKATLQRLADGELRVADAVLSGSVVITGDEADLDALFGHLDTFMSNFHIVEP